MKNIEFTNITVEDFCSHRGAKSFDLGKKTIIKGQNGVGKSTLKKAILYALSGKDESGMEIRGIRPHDESGKDIDGLTASAQLTISVNGLKNTIKKTYRQKKNRQGEYTGENDTQYFIDDVKKGTKKSYEDFVRSVIPNSICINAQDFLRKDVSGRRQLLEKTFGRHSVEDIIAENPEFECLAGKLKANSVQDLKKAYRGRKKELGAKLIKIRHQIEFEQANKKDVDLAELELQRNALKEQIADIEAKEVDILKQCEDYRKLSEGVLSLNFELSNLGREANEENIKERKAIEDKIDEKEFLVFKTGRTIRKTETDISNSTDKIEKLTDKIVELRERYEVASKREFDENSPVCPYCGQEYPEDERERLRADFDRRKQEELVGITEQGNATKKDLEDEKEAARTLDIELLEHRKGLEMLNDSIEELNKELSALPERIDISDREDIKEIKRQIAEKEATMKQSDDAVKVKQNLANEKSEYQRELIEVEAKFKVAEENVAADDRIADLKKTQREVAQNIADVEWQMDLLDRFESRKAEILERDVNGAFDSIQIKIHERQINGEIKEVCQILVGGESYDRNLNHGARILAEIDICRAFQKANNVCLPIIVDDCESLDDWRVPSIENQLIIIKRSDDKELKIEMEG